ncbi:MAG: tripartite tricarboxylate transporter substrate binding protein [Roseomonas sp.]|nr:tripartite tricarboxylate transporter substrate binding protein [Roseomonas sp.]
MRRFGSYKLVSLFAAAVITLGFGAVASAANWQPVRPIRFIVPFAPGGNSDIQGRAIASRLTVALGKQVVVDNRPGAGGALGAELAASSAPDGYTIVLGTFGSILVAPALNPKLRYNPAKDFAPIILVSTPPSLIVASPAVPAKNVRDLVAYARANPNRMSYGSAGSGSFSHLAAELFRSMAKIEIVHVPYKGAAPAIVDLLANQLQMVVAPFPPVLPHVNTGRITALAVTGDKRSPSLPNVLTVAEAGVPGYEASGWFAVLAPAGTSKPIVDRYNFEINRMFADAEIRAAFAAEGSGPVGGSPGQLAESINTGLAKWGRLVRELKISAQ